MTEPVDLAFDVRVLAESQGAVRVLVAGEIDTATAPALEQALNNERDAGRSVLLDLGDVTFMDSSGVAVLLYAINEAKLDGWDLSVRDALRPPVQQVLNLTGTLPMLPLVEE